MRATKKKKVVAIKKKSRRNKKIKQQIDDAVKRVVDEYGDVLKRLGKEE